MNDNTVSTFELGDALATRFGNTLTGVFVPGSKIALSAYRHVKWNSRDVPSETAGQDPVLIYLAQETTLFDEPVLRSLLAESNITFATLQELGQKAPRAEYLRISHTYRSVVRASLERLEHAKKSPEVQMDGERQQRISETVIVFYAAECLWHLFEILYMQQSQLIVPQLLNWARFYAPQIEDRATDFLLMAEEASENDDYWNVLKSLVMVGALDVTRAILRQNRKASQPAFKAVELILASMPVCKEGFPLKKFNSQWEHWHVDAERKIQANAFQSEPELEQILQLVTGSNEHWDAGIKESNEWYEFLPGYLLYTKPTCKPFELKIAAANWLNRWTLLRPCSQLNNMARMISQLMEHDLRLFIYDTQRINDTNWLTTHMIDLIYHSGELKGYFEQNNIDLPALRHSMIYEYGSYLMSTRSLWQLGIDYLDCCKQEGKAAMELLLPRISLRSDRHALKIMSVARKRGLIDVEQEICKVLSRQSFDDERYGNALEWGIRSKDVLLVTGIADFILKNYSRTGNMLCPDVIVHIKSSMFISPRLVFLFKYFEFYELYRNRDFLAAVELLVNLLNSKITPDYFWPSLLIDTVPLLESKDPKIFSNETVAILHHLETELVPIIERNTDKLGNQKNAETVFKDYRAENIDEILNILRLACARNLARSLVIENTSPES
ncbi:nuclear pore complex protein Nup75 isoform X1 [Drosophila miranda]|uniref:nuclear pore complex protein Nup75 isoform X1 n=1 Tax=Drosophila miranda TaxID=7229 RepID=UPI0007E86FC8|nr:nuclear pore complex protein Nup75 isoform X1 [Drosophila miranda]